MDWHNIFKVIISKDLQPKVHYSSKLSFTVKEHIKSFPNRTATKKLK